MIYKKKKFLQDITYIVPFFERKGNLCRNIENSWCIGDWYTYKDDSRYEPYLDVTIEELKLIEAL